MLALVPYRALSTDHRRTLKHSLLLFGGLLLLDALAAVFAARGAGDVASGLVRLSHSGVELSSLVATSAVITAVLAFAMQDTLGNILGGLALQLDNSLAIGDCVKVDELSVRVVEIQWRYTAIFTRNGGRVVIPNTQLKKGKFMVVGDTEGGAPGTGTWRRWIWFDVAYDVSPARVIQAVAEGTAEAEIPNVSRHPPPSCVAMAFEAGSVRYALRYWLIDPRDDDPTDSAVRCHLLATLQRNGWRIAIPDQSVHLVQEDEAHREAVWKRELARRLKALAGIELGEAQEAFRKEQHEPTAHRVDILQRVRDFFGLK